MSEHSVEGAGAPWIRYCNGLFTPKIFYIGWTSDGHQTEWVPIQYTAAFTHIICRKDGDWIYIRLMCISLTQKNI